MGIAIEKSIKNIRENGEREQKENKRSRATEWRFRNKSEPLYYDAVAQIIDDRRKLETLFRNRSVIRKLDMYKVSLALQFRSCCLTSFSE